MNHHPGITPRPDDVDAGWLRELLHDDAAQAPYLDDAGFTARVVQALPRSRRRWLDNLSAAAAVVAFGVGLLYFSGLLQVPLAQFTDGLIGYFSFVLAQPLSSSLLALLAPLLALYLAGAALVEEYV